MNQFRRFTYIFIVIFICNYIFHILSYTFFVKKVNPKNHMVGDLARVSYYLPIVYPRKKKVIKNSGFINYPNYKNEPIEILTIGDSFSNGGGGFYYQNIWATKVNINILNIMQLPNTKNYIETIALLFNSGYLEKIGVKYILLESVQRESIRRFSYNNINFDLNTDENIEKLIKSVYDIYNPKKEDQQEIAIINNLNFNAIKYNLKFYLKGYGNNKEYYIEKLNKSLFSTDKGNEIIFHEDDIKNLSFENIRNINHLNQNLNELAKQLKSKKIKLYFMPVVDKYNLYADNIISNKYPRSIFFEELDKLPKDYNFINTKKILAKKLKLKEKDLFLPDDSHWNIKASKIVLDSIILE